MRGCWKTFEGGYLPPARKLIGERKALLVGLFRGRAAKAFLLVAQHAGNELPRGPRRVAPGRRHCNPAPGAVINIEADQAAERREGRLPLFIGEMSDFNEAAFDGDFGSVQQPGGHHEVELIRVAQTDTAFQRLFHFAEKVGAGNLDLVAHALHGSVGKAIEREGIQALRRIVTKAGPDPQFAQEDPLGGPRVEACLNDIEQGRRRERIRTAALRLRCGGNCGFEGSGGRCSHNGLFSTHQCPAFQQTAKLYQSESKSSLLSGRNL